METMDAAAFRAVLDVNTTATMFVLKEAARVLRAQRTGGSIVLQASKNTFAPGKGFAAYSASKAGADHLVRAYQETYGLPTLITNCSNNYGPFQFPEKLIPLMLHQALAGKPLPVYGDGQNVRDWLYVADHCDAVRLVLAKGRVGETYNIGGNAEKKNLDLVHALCALLDEMKPRKGGRYAELIAFVKDRPGHDRRYAIDAAKIRRELGWQPRESFETGLAKTVRWYFDRMGSE